MLNALIENVSLFVSLGFDLHEKEKHITKTHDEQFRDVNFDVSRLFSK